MVVDFTIALGTILHLGSLLIALIACYFGLVRRLDRHEESHKSVEQKINMIWKWFKHEHGINGNPSDNK